MDEFTRYWNEATKLDRDRIGRKSIDWANQPQDRKTYPGAEIIALPAPAELEIAPADLWSALANRRSVRRYTDEPLKPGELAALLWACQGVTAVRGPYHMRTAPSAGALYPFETYVFINNVEGVSPCLAHFDPFEGKLEVVAQGLAGPVLAEAALRQKFLREAPAVFAWSAVPGRCEWKYGDRAARYIGMDLGHVCQNLLLGAVGLGLGGCAVAAFLDDELNALMGLDGDNEYALYLASVGTPRIETCG